MRIIQSAREMRRLAERWQRGGVAVGLVPTMGSLHAGHLSLVQRARKLAGLRGKVVVSIYVNPTQFGPTEDFSRYPRDLAGDARLCREEGVDVVFAPGDQEMYPPGFSTYVVEGVLSKGMEGAARPTHFQGVATVVAKLLNLVRPRFAVFGAKDFQQAAVIQRMVRDLNLPLKIVMAPIYREADGLAMSSRNRYLDGELRTQAVVLWQAIQKGQAAVKRAPSGLPAAKLKAELREFIERQPAVQVDYVEFFDPETLTPVSKAKRGVQMALAVFVGRTRLIDNAKL